jgi:hypothetical protein
MTINAPSYKTLLVYWIDNYNIKTRAMEIPEYL